MVLQSTAENLFVSMITEKGIYWIQKKLFFPRILSSSVKLIYMPNSANHLNNKKKTKTKPAEISTKQLSVFHKSFKAALSLFILIAEINSRIYLQ